MRVYQKLSEPYRRVTLVVTDEGQSAKHTPAPFRCEVCNLRKRREQIKAKAQNVVDDKRTKIQYASVLSAEDV